MRKVIEMQMKLGNSFDKGFNNSAVESSINALKNNSLYCCLDHGIEGLKRYVAISV